MKRVVVICPGGAATGGLELLHQLVDAVNALARIEARICYYPFYRSFQTHPHYRQYDCPQIKFADIDRAADWVVLPEVFTHLIGRFALRRMFLWWLSVDNYILSGTFKFCFFNKLWPWRFVNIRRRADLFNALAGNLFQSDYAREFLFVHGVHRAQRLGDYINDDYGLAAGAQGAQARRDIVVYNPAKGIEATRALMACLSEFEFVPIKNMNRAQVVRLLLSAKVYIDFGTHPGRDRIPREAAVLGCCIVTNRRGSAGNALDVNIPAAYKIDDTLPAFAQTAAARIRAICADFDAHARDFDAYRADVFTDKARFTAEVRQFVELLCAGAGNERALP